jgi:hypothetical protein
MAEELGINGKKPTNSARIAALEGAVVEIRTTQQEQGKTQQEQGKILTAVQSDCLEVKNVGAQTRADTAQILAALKELGLTTASAQQQGATNTSALSLTTPPHAALQVQVMRAFNALGPLGTIALFVYLVAKGYI